MSHGVRSPGMFCLTATATPWSAVCTGVMSRYWLT